MEKTKKEDMEVNYHKGMPDSDHWEKDVSDSVFPKNKIDNPATAFFATSGTKRPQPHVKVNECDH